MLLKRLARRFHLTIAHAYLLFYLGLYFAVIVGWAALYMRHGAEFYSPYARLEPAFKQERSAVEKMLDDDVVKIFLNPTHLPHDMSIDPRTIVGVLTVAPDDNPNRAIQAAFVVFLTRRVPGSKPALFAEHVTLHISNLISISEKVKGQATMFSEVEASPVANGDSGDRSTLPAEDSPERVCQDAFSSIPVRDETIRRLLAFSTAYTGQPQNLPGTFSRMLYLSAITATTVGYGDIVPLTPMTRFLTAAEATTGVVLLGLFVSGISSLQSSKKDAEANGSAATDA